MTLTATRRRWMTIADGETRRDNLLTLRAGPGKADTDGETRRVLAPLLCPLSAAVSLSMTAARARPRRGETWGNQCEYVRVQGDTMQLLY